MNDWMMVIFSLLMAAVSVSYELHLLLPGEEKAFWKGSRSFPSFSTFLTTSAIRAHCEGSPGYGTSCNYFQTHASIYDIVTSALHELQKWQLGLYFTTLHPFSPLVSSDPKLHLGATWETDFWEGANTFNESSAAREEPQEKSEFALSSFLNKKGFEQASKCL